MSLYKRTKNKRKVTLFSYPRSGSNWISYCIEQISNLNVCGSDGHIGDINVELRLESDPKALVHKVHGGKEIWSIFNDGNGNEGMLLNIRNYKESILRDAPNKPKYPTIHPIEDMKSFLVGLNNETNSSDYLRMVQEYDRYEGPKLMMDYEDLILDPLKELNKLQDWLVQFGGDGDKSRVINFMSNYDQHKNFSMKRYISIHGTTATDGDPKKLKIQKETWLDDKTEKEIDDFVESQDPLIYEKYLKRYKL